MDKETADYIIRYFKDLMTDNEKLALNYHMYTYKSSDSPYLRSMMIEKGWISTDPQIVELLQNGYEEFELNVAQRILADIPEKIFFNNCPQCYKLARTPYARQCRHCGYDWHHLTVAQFKLSYTHQITNRHFFLFGQIIKGEIKVGQKIDLTLLGLNKKPIIETIEFAFKHKDGQVWEDIALGTYVLTEMEKMYLKDIGSFPLPIDIICE
nr:hypothetical protein [uncultured Chryseobacterium sp.]